MKLGASALERRYAVTPPRYPVLTDDIDLTTPALPREAPKPVPAGLRADAHLEAGTFVYRGIGTSDLHVRPMAGATPLARDLVPAQSLVHVYMGADPKRWVRDLPMPGVLHASGSTGRVWTLSSDTETRLVLRAEGAGDTLEFELSERSRVEVSPDGVDVASARGGVHLGAARSLCVADGSIFPAPRAYAATARGVSLGAKAAGAVHTQLQVHGLGNVGGHGDDRVFGVAVSPDNRWVYLAGATTLPDFSRAARGDLEVADDVTAFLTCYERLSGAERYTVFFGGRAQDRALALCVGPEGDLFVAGETCSDDFPGAGRAYDAARASWDGFVTRFRAADGALLWTARVGASMDDRIYAIVADGSDLLVAGESASSQIPMLAGYGGGWDALLARVSSAGEVDAMLRYGGQRDDSAFALARGPAGVHIVGQTDSDDLPGAAGPQRMRNRVRDAFAARLNAELSAVTHATYFGGDNDDRAFAVGVRDDIVYVGGETASTNFPITPGSFYGGGAWDGFLLTFNPSLERVVDARYLGGPAHDRVEAISMGDGGRVAVAGSHNVRRGRAALRQAGAGGAWDGWLRIFADGIRDERSAHGFGGAGDDHVHAVAAVGSDTWVFAGEAVDATWTSAFGVRALPGRERDGLSGALIRHLQPPALSEVRAGEQPRGPAYTFHMGTFETTHAQYARFLNDVEANPGTVRAKNVHIDDAGDVWFNPLREREQHELFRISKSRLRYDGTRPAGYRYAVSARSPRVGSSYASHPVTGVSWFGAVKYCNWLTLTVSRGVDALCYREGTNTVDWAPISCPPEVWARGEFPAEYRQAWLQYDGFRLPMDDSIGKRSVPGAFNEFYKAAAWNGERNTRFGFGRDKRGRGDANFLNHGASAWHDTTPVGYYDGVNLEGEMRTVTNANAYGIYDLSGNVSEWMTDPGSSEQPRDRACYGGSWIFALPELAERFYLQPHFVDSFRGFRVATMRPYREISLTEIPVVLYR